MNKKTIIMVIHTFFNQTLSLIARESIFFYLIDLTSLNRESFMNEKQYFRHRIFMNIKLC